MKNLIRILLFTVISTPIFAQKSFTIEDAYKYALENNVQIKKAIIDQEIAQQKVKETIGIGVPQVTGQAKYTNYLNIPVQLMPNALFGKFDGGFSPVQFGQQHNGSAGISVSQLLFNGSYIVGLESAKTYKETAALVKEKTDLSIKMAIMLSYAGVLVTDENIKTLLENQKVAAKSLNDTKETYKLGLIELQNVEQLEYSYKSLETNIRNLKRTREQLLTSLKYLMGFQLDDSLELITSLDELVQKNQVLLPQENSLDFSQHIDVRLKQNQIRISELLLKLQKSIALPTLVAFFNTQSSAQNGTFSLFNTSQKWFNTSLFGVQLDVPIFSGFQRHWQTEEAKLSLKKAKLDKDDTEKSLKNNFLARKTDYDNANDSYQTAQELVKLSSSIYNKQQLKFKEGMGTSMELQQAETQLYGSQSTYYQSALNLIQAKTKLDEALGKL